MRAVLLQRSRILVRLVICCLIKDGWCSPIGDATEPPQTIFGVAGDKVILPCNITPPEDDAVALVLWYKDESTTPLYSLDARRGSLNQARHAASDELNSRAYLSISHRPASLQLNPVLESDDGQYRCRVDFKKARTRNWDVILSIIVPPKKPIITDQNGEILQSLIGPYNEDDSLHLVCETEGGKPLPSLTWWRESVLLDDSYEVSPMSVVRNEMRISKLERHDLMAVFTCQASNNNISVPVSTYVTVDMNFRPTDVQIEGNRRPLSASKPAELVCRATGSRPPATITWWKGNSKMKRTKDRVSINGYDTTSILIFTPTSEDSGKYLSCRAENLHIKNSKNSESSAAESAIEDGWKLEIHYVPQLTLRLGSKLRHSHIQEGNDVYFECNIRASPWVTEIGWRFEGRELHTNTSAGIIVSNQSLVLQKVQRSSRGRYTCTGTNSEGQGESNHVSLRVQYSPVCKSGQKIIYGTARHESAHVSCEVEADPQEVKFRWEFNNSAESLEIMTFVDEGKTSTAKYTPRTEFDFGTLLCWGTNTVGNQKEPCVYTIVPAGQPDAVENCTVINQTEDGLKVECLEGYDGGLQQYFLLEVYDSAHYRLQANVTSKTPVFVVRGLPSGTTFFVVVSAVNSKGRSHPVDLRPRTLPGPESQTRKDNVWQLNFSPVLIVLITVVVGLVFVALVVVLVMKFKVRRGRNKGGALARKSYKLQTPLRKDDDHNDSSKSPGEEKCPDIIPDVNIQAEQMNMGDGNDKQFLSSTSHDVIHGVNGIGQNINSLSHSKSRLNDPETSGISRSPVVQPPPSATLREYSHISSQKRVKVLPVPIRGDDEDADLNQRHYGKNIQTDV